MNFDDAAFGDGLRQFLAQQFPQPSRYERPDRVADEPGLPRHTAPPSASTAWYPPVKFKTRDEFGSFRNRHGLEGEGVAVGIHRGEFAATMLRRWQGRRLHCVDLWIERTQDPRYVDIVNLPQPEQEKAYQETVRRLSEFGDRCQVHRRSSQEAAAQFPNGSLDFVYVDHRPYREALLEELELWLPKVRPGGFLAGHDYLDGLLPSGRFEVKTTVDQWAAQRGLSIVCSGEHVWRSWFIRR